MVDLTRSRSGPDRPGPVGDELGVRGLGQGLRFYLQHIVLGNLGHVTNDKSMTTI